MKEPNDHAKNVSLINVAIRCKVSVLVLNDDLPDWESSTSICGKRIGRRVNHGNETTVWMLD